jgi:urea transport system permease protein
MSGTDLISALLNGLSYSSILILVALGLSITFGVMRVINMAHGEMIMLGAYTAYCVTDPSFFGLSLYYFELDPGFGPWVWRISASYWAIPIAFVVVGLFGYLLEGGLIRFLYGRPLDTLLATWGVGLILQQAVRLSFGAEGKPLEQPVELRGALPMGDVTFPYYRILILGVSLLCVTAVYLCFYRTRLGLQIRAVTQNRAMASALGISTRRVDALTFAIGTGFAGVAGSMVGYLQIKPDMGTVYLIDAFLVVILGGMGQLHGTVAAGLLIGMGKNLVEKFYNTSAPEMISQVASPMALVTVLLVVIGFILARPTGLFATRERVYD